MKMQSQRNALIRLINSILIVCTMYLVFSSELIYSGNHFSLSLSTNTNNSVKVEVELPPITRKLTLMALNIS
jgi:hypothetical protein